MRRHRKAVDRHLHLEHDGKMLLVDESGAGPQQPLMGRLDWPGRGSGGEGDSWLLRLPTESEVSSMEIEWMEKRTNIVRFGGEEHVVTHGTPDLDWPVDWAWKDELVSDSAVHPIARESVYRTMHRLVSKVIVRDSSGCVLLGLVERGHFTGHWTLPGGYLDYAEHPREGAEREAFEEMGLTLNLDDPWGEMGGVKIGNGFTFVQERIFSDAGIQYISFTYLVDLKERPDLTPKVGEISEAGWFKPQEARRLAASLFDVEALDALERAG